MPLVVAPGDGLCDRPPAGSFAVHAEAFGQRVESPDDLLAGVAELPGTDDGREGERPLPHERLRVDREPRLPGCPQDVAGVEVLVDDDLLTLRGPSLLEERDDERRDGEVFVAIGGSV